jgi:GDP-L-fucose synthase
VAGHQGMVGSAIVRHLKAEGYGRIIERTHDELDLIDQKAVADFFRSEGIDYVVLAAAKVGGIYANKTYPADFIRNNLMIQCNVIHEAYKAGVQRLLFLGSSCIYPKFAAQPMTEELLLTGLLEPTNEPYAIAKIAGIKLCEAYNRQYRTKFRSVMPTNLYGPADNYDLENSHVIPAMIRKFHLAKLASQGKWNEIEKDEACYGAIPDDIYDNLKSIRGTRQTPEGSRSPELRLWGTGTPRREFLHVNDMASACVFLMRLNDEVFNGALKGTTAQEYEKNKIEKQPSDRGEDRFPPVSHINIGSGRDITIAETAEMVKRVVNTEVGVFWDHSRPDGTPQKWLNVDRLQRLGWKPRLSLSQGLEDTYRAYRSRLDGC